MEVDIKISVIIPCYKCADVIGRAIESVMNQTIGCENIELILVNDHTPDERSVQVLQEYEQRYQNQIVLVYCDKNAGQSTARNIGIEYARGEYITFLDQDDWIDPNMYRSMYEKAIRYDCDIISSLHKLVIQGKIQETEAESDDSYIMIENMKQRRTLLLTGVSLIGGNTVWNKLYRRSFIMEHEIRFPYDRLLWEDYYFNRLCMLYVCGVYNISDYYYFYNQHENATFLKLDQAYHLDILKIALLLQKEYRKRGFYEYYREELEISFVQDYVFKGLHAIFTRFHNPPVYLIKEMKETFMRECPDIFNNFYILNMKDVWGLLGMDDNKKHLWEEFVKNTTEKKWHGIAEEYLEKMKDNFTGLNESRDTPI